MQLVYDSSRPSSHAGKGHAAALLTSIICIALLCLLLPGCTRNELTSEVTQSFAIAFTKHDLDNCLALFTDDAQILPEHGTVISGHKEIENFLKNSMTPIISFKTETDMLLVRSDIGVEQGHFTVRNIKRGADIEMGKYMHIWKRQDGKWMLYRVIYNTDVAPEGYATVESLPDENS
ncbi:MAG: nuclear transport factor 2 family protein [Steroidobacteraceae bacterium]